VKGWRKAQPSFLSKEKKAKGRADLRDPKRSAARQRRSGGPKKLTKYITNEIKF